MKPSPVNEFMLRAFQDEMEKIALNPAVVGRFLRAKGGSILRGARHFPGEVVGDIWQSAKNVASPSTALQKTKEMFTQGPMWQRALVGAGTVMDAANVIPEEDPSGQGLSRTQRAFGAIGSTIGGAAGKGFIGSTLTGMAGNHLGNVVGGAMDRLRGRRPVVPSQLVTPPPTPAAQPGLVPPQQYT